MFFYEEEEGSILCSVCGLLGPQLCQVSLFFCVCFFFQINWKFLIIAQE